jgi:hypothetical protein
VGNGVLPHGGGGNDDDGMAAAGRGSGGGLPARAEEIPPARRHLQGEGDAGVRHERARRPCRRTRRTARRAGEQLTEQGGQLTDQGGRVENLEIALGQTCSGAPERAAIFLDALGICDNACQPIPPCVDAARTDSVGDCDDVTTQPACEQSWGISSGYPTSDSLLKPTACYWNGADCDECQPNDVSEGNCTNTCITLDQTPVCRAEGRTYGDCDALDGNEAGCLSTFEITSFGTHTCWYDAGECTACDPEDEHAGSCQNLC